MTKKKSKKSKSRTLVYSEFEVERMISMLKSLLRNHNHSEREHFEKMLARYETLLKEMGEE